jgi:type IV secretory pathway VirB2 component (pilin)
MSKKMVIGLSALVMAFGLALLPAPSLAESTSCKTSLECVAGETCQKDAGATEGTCVKDTFGLNPVGNQVKGKLGNQDLRETAANLINVLLGILGLIAVVIVLAGGFKWMTAGGNDEKVGEARKMIFSGVIGLAIILSAWAISLFVINQLSTATGGNADIPAQN